MTFSDDFPALSGITMSVRKTGHSARAEHIEGIVPNEWTYVERSPGLRHRHLRCGNPRCESGGLDWKVIIFSMITAKESHVANRCEPCPGFKTCQSSFHVTVDLTYKV